MRTRSAKRKPPPDPDSTVDIETLMAEVVPDHETWKQIPNAALNGKRPVDLIGTPQEHLLRDMLLAAKYGIYS